MKTSLRKRLFLVPAVPLLFLTACAPANFEAIQQISSETTAAIGCSSFESKTWDAVHGFLIEQKSVPSAQDVKETLRRALKEVKTTEGSLSETEMELLAKDIGDLYELMLTETASNEKVRSSEDLLQALSALELGDQTTPVKARMQQKLKAQFSKIKLRAQGLDVGCQVPEEIPAKEELDLPQVESNAGGLPPAVFGANWTMATAYQTCQALTEPALTKATADLKGVVITGNHSDGVGSKREIASIPSVLKTHPYYKNVNNYGSSCLNMRNAPLIYDYGGKPYVTTAAGAPLNLFRSAGNGTKVLGIDCSGYIYTALATAGLRITPLRNMKGTGVYGIGSTMYVEPQKNNMACLQKISVKPRESIKAGDIVAVPGHVLMVDSVGADPFGINTIGNADSCAKISYKNFNFVVIQSSNSKEGVGINRFQAKEYLAETAKMRVGLERYAYYSCLARFNSRDYTPNLGTLSVVRHKGTPECIGTRIALSQESCIRSCPQLSR